MGKTNVQALTISVGNFIREVRNGNGNPSMRSILLKNGVNSATRATQLIERMLENHIIVKHKDGSYSLTKANWDSAEVMNALLNVPRKPRVKRVAVPQATPFAQFTAQELVAELRRRGYEVVAKREIITVEEL